MFILATGAQAQYNFKVQISEEGNLQFAYEGQVINYQGLAEFIKQQYLDKVEKLKKEIVETKKLQKRLKRFNSIVEDLTQEYLARQRQIATFLECKKTFFGRVKYYFKKKKEVAIVKKPEKVERDSLNENQELQELYEEKEQYTIEDLINICTKLQEKGKQNTNINLDINAIESKKDVLTKKIDNADLYIKEIDKHKKSIFEFWKFTSKDEVQTLNQGEELQESKREKIEKYFNYETDFEDLGKIVDEIQRRKLSKNETDSIFAAKHAIELFRELDENRKTTDNKRQEIEEVQSNENMKTFEKELKKLQEEYKENIEYINMKDFDIFGGLSEDKTKIKTINNQKHREIEKDKYKVLNVNLDTEVSVYRNNLKYYLGLISESLNKILSPYNMSVYKINNKKGIDGINIFDINPENALKEGMQTKKENIILCRVNIKEGMPVIFYSNIMFYDNFNKTLPLGMDLSSEILIDLEKIKVKCVKEEEFNINYSINEYDVITKKVKVYEYDSE